MSPQIPFLSRLRIEGEVCTIRLVITTPFGREFDARTAELLQEEKGTLQEEVQVAVRKLLGRAFDVHQIIITRGSVELLIVIGTVYYAISRYKSFVESIELLTSHLRLLVQRLLGRVPSSGPVVISADWFPGPSLAAAMQRENRADWPETAKLMLAYLILSHAGLLGIVAWVLIKALK